MDLRNGNNTNLTDFIATGNPNLFCIDVDDVAYATTNFTQIDAQTNFSIDCATALGCTDSLYMEYNPNATIDDGSCVTLITYTYVPDDTFETYLENNGWGDGVANNNTVLTPNISGVTTLNIYGLGITDLTGIEDFDGLTHLLCHNNNIDSIDVSNNTALVYFLCMNNPSLSYLDLSNGNNTNLANFNVTNNPLLNCISVDDVIYASNNFTWVDPQVSFSTDCTNAILGCTNPTACNFDSNANTNNDSCFFATENYDCGGNCTSELDCNGACGGIVQEDVCGVCQGDGWSCSPMGDVNQDYSVDISDIIIIINFILSGNLLEGNALLNADWNASGDVNLVDVVNIINIILGEDLTKGEDPSFIKLLYNNDNLSLNSNGKIGGLQIEYIGKIEIKQSYLPNDWLISYNDHTLLIYSLEGTGLTNNKLFDIIGDIKILSALGVGRNGKRLDTEILFIPTEFALHPSYPNPFNPTTTIKLGVQETLHAMSLRIFDINGRLIETLIEGKIEPGFHEVKWNAENLPSGVYFVHFISDKFTQTQKILLMK